MKFEDLLHQVGDEHRFQFWVIALLLLPTSLFNSFYDSIILFTTPDHWCNVPELAQLPLELQHSLIRPFNNKTEKLSNCKRYDLNYTLIQSMEDFDNFYENQSLSSISTVECKNGWHYDQSLYSETAVSWFNLVCNKDFYVNIIISFTWSGMVLLTPLISNLSDRIGRRYTTLITFAIAVLSCLSPILFRNLPSYVFCRFMAAGIMALYYQLPFVITQETVSEKYRTRSSSLSAMTYSIGSCFVPIVAKLTGNWVNFALVQFALTMPYIIFFKYLPESPSWLISTKQFDKAHKELVRICKFNRKPVPDDLMKSIELVYHQKSKETEDNFMQLLTEPGLRFKTFAITMAFIACCIGYGGISMNTINMEAENQLYNVFYLALTDIPASLLGWYLLTTRMGRRWTSVGGLMLCGLSLLVPAAIPGASSKFVTACTIVGKFGVASTYMVVYQQSGELYPTTLRSQGMGFSVAVQSVIGIFLPQLVYLGKFGEWIPLFIMGVSCILGGIVVSFLPETLNEYLAQNVKEAAEFGADQKYFSLANKIVVKNALANGQLETEMKKSDTITPKPINVDSKLDP